MADDGILINFDTSTQDAGLAGALPKWKGGSWRDKLSAKKAHLHYRERLAKGQQQPTVKTTQSQVATPQEVHDFPSEQSAKRVKTSHHQSGGRNDHQKKPLQVVSSLFSYNPKATTVEQEQGDSRPAAKASNAPLDPALQNFTSLGVSTSLAEHLLNKMEIKAPTGIQRASLERLLKKDTDAFIQAETGSGKTLAYLLPIVQRLMSLSADSKSDRIHRDSGLFAIILTPTRELSKQISTVLESLLRCAHWLVSGTVVGGEKKKSEKARLRKGLNILIATPGRLADHLDNTEVLDVSKVRWLVLDEGDRLMEMGFEKDIDRILSKLEKDTSRGVLVPGLPAQRATILCSATLKSDVQKLGERSLKDAVHVKAKYTDSEQTVDEETGFAAPAQLQQSYIVVPAKLRLVALVAFLKRNFLRRGSVMKAIVFMSCSDTVDFHFDLLSRAELEEKTGDSDEKEAGEISATKQEAATSTNAETNADATALSSKDNQVKVFRLHGSLPQPVRTSTLSKYRSCKDPAVLVCTDVASRGLDLPNVDLVLEFDPAFSKDDHLHRIGRTARAGREGRASVFLLPGAEEQYIPILKSFRSAGGRVTSPQSVDELLKKGFGSTGLGGGGDWEERATEWQLGVERWALESPRVLEMARRAYQSHIRAYATHVAAEKECFDLAQVHLGHLAKAFALRDKPGSIRVPGKRPGKGAAEKNKHERKAAAGAGGKRKAGAQEDETPVPSTANDGRKKLLSKMREQANMSEFNLG